MNAVKNIRTIVLTKEFLKVRVVDYKETICALVTGRAKPVHEYQVFYTMDEWYAFACSNISDDRAVHSARMIFHVPEYIVYLNSKTPICHPKLSRKNIWLRDNKKCVYCGTHVAYKDSTVDHVYPSSKGGKSLWNNVVITCFECNNKKGDTVLDPMEMKSLSSVLRVPTWLELVSKNQDTVV